MKSLRTTFREYKREVIVSLVTMFIVYVLTSLFQYVRDGGKVVINIFRDFIYYEMGRMSDLAIVEFACSIILGSFFALAIITALLYIFGDKIFTRDNNKSKNKKSNKKILGFLTIASTIFLFLYALGFVYCLDRKHKFDLQMTAIKPYITQEKYDLIYSEWVTMMSREDYKNIKKEIFRLRCEYVITNEDIKAAVCK